MLLISLSLAWLLGILAATVFTPAPGTIAIFALPLSLFPFRRFRLFAIKLSVLILLFLGGAICAHSQDTNADGSQLKFYNGSEVKLQAVVSADPEVRDAHTRIHMSAASLELDGTSHEISGDLIIYICRYPEYHYGDFLELEGALSAPNEFDGFDYAGYLANQNIYSLMYYPSASRIGSGSGNAFLSAVYQIRRSLSDSLARTLPEPQASVAQGILLGIRANIPEDVTNNFIGSGTMHLLAISGLNLTLISGLLISLLVRLLGRRHYLYVWLAAGAIWLYVVLCGASPSVVRAAVMASIFLAAELAGRQKLGGPALFLAAAAMAALNPHVLRDVSFQLSFLSMYGLIYIYPSLGEATRKFTARFQNSYLSLSTLYILDNLAISLSAMLAIWPLLVFYFGKLSIVGPVATILTAPVLPLIILLSLATATIGLMLPVLALILGVFVWLAASYLMWIASIFSRLPVIQANGLNPLVMLVYYAALGSVLWWITRIKRRELAGEGVTL